MSARIQIHFCTQCRWMLRAVWMAQEILTTFEQDVAEVALVPGTGGVFRVVASEQVVWDRTVEEGFPQPKELKQRLRDVIAPGKNLGHSDR